MTRCLDKAKDGGRAAESCIGSVRDPCTEEPDGGSTVGMRECAARETRVWDERLNAAYRASLKTYSEERSTSNGGRTTVSGPDMLREAERAWLNHRDKKCEAATLPMNGGTGAGILGADCFMRETARQALWLEELNEGMR